MTASKYSSDPMKKRACCANNPKMFVALPTLNKDQTEIDNYTFGIDIYNDATKNAVCGTLKDDDGNVSFTEEDKNYNQNDSQNTQEYDIIGAYFFS